MMENLELQKFLIQKGKELHNKPRYFVPFSNNEEADKLLNNIEQYPHFFVFGCIMNRQTKAWKAWLIPYLISKEIESSEFAAFLDLDKKYLIDLFTHKSLHWMSIVMATNLHKAIQRIHFVYEDNAANIWLKKNPNTSELIIRFRDFDGIGQKISTMAVNTLVREFKVKLSDYRDIDISIDTHVRRLFRRFGFVEENANDNDIIKSARRIYPEYPGIYDSICWEVGEAWCHPSKPNCSDCILSGFCPKIIE